MFVREYFTNHLVIDPELIVANIEYARFPPPLDRNLETDTYPGLLRAAQVIGAIADPDFCAEDDAAVVGIERVRHARSTRLQFSDGCE